MKDYFKQSASLVWNGKFLPSSGYGRLAQALGVMSAGGMSAEGSTFRLDSLDFGMAAAQIMVSEAGLPQIVCGVGFDINDRHTYVAMTDGSIWRFVSYLESGNLVTEAWLAENDFVLENCQDCLDMVETIKTIAVSALTDAGQIEEDDSFSGHVLPDAWSAIMMSCKATGKFIVRDPRGAAKSGWVFALNAPPYATTAEVSSVLMFQQMTEEEIKKESADYLKAIGLEGKIFPAHVGKA